MEKRASMRGCWPPISNLSLMCWEFRLVVLARFSTLSSSKAWEDKIWAHKRWTRARKKKYHD